MTDESEEIKKVGPRTVRACAIARGEQDAPEEPLGRLCVGNKDVNARGSVHGWWYAMRWNGSTWEYPSDDRLPTGMFLASDRRASIYADVYEGDVFVTHNRGGGIDSEGWVIRVPNTEKGEDKAQKTVTLVKRLRSGLLRIELPDGTSIERPNPRAPRKR